MTSLISVRGSVDEFDSAEWASVSASLGLYSSLSWHRLLEAEPGWDVWYAAARDERDRLQGVMPVHLHAGGPRGGVERYYDPRVLFAEAEPGDSATLLLGGRAGYETELLLRPDLSAADRRATLAALVARCRRLATAWGADGLAALYLTSAAAAELREHLGRAPLLTDVGAVIDLRGLRSLDDHLSRLSAHRRRRIARERREFGASGLTVRWGGLSESAGVVGGLLAQLHRRHGHGDGAAMLAAHFARQAEHLDAYSHVAVCERAGEPVGCLLAYEWGATWYARAAGFADGLRDASAAFFNVAYYAAIERAIERGMAAYDLGPSSLGTKLLRGARPEPRWSLVAVDGLDTDGCGPRAVTRWDAELAALGRPTAAAEWGQAVLSAPALAV